MVQPRFPKHDLYKVLEVDSNASSEEIKKAYRELCKKVHPDKAEGGNTPENTERFQQVQEAWEILRDEVLRREYDEYRASSPKEDDSRDDKDGDSGRRHKERRERSGKKERNPRGSARPKSDRTHRHEEDTYEPKPNRSKKPYYEDWSETDQNDDSKSYGAGAEPGSWHYGAPPFYGSGGPPPPPPPQYGSYNQGYCAQNRPRPIKLEDRILAMRIRLDLNAASQSLDCLQAEFKSFTRRFKARFDFDASEKKRWGSRFEDVLDALDFLDGTYDTIHYRLRAIETGRGKIITLDLPELLGVLSAHITRIKYSLTAAFIILDQLSGYVPYEAEQRLFHSLEGRLGAMKHRTTLDSSWAAC